MEVLAEEVNSINHRNNLTSNGVSSSATFGQATAVNDPRVMQLALRVKF